MSDSSDNPWLSRLVPRGEDYDRRFDALAASGTNVHGEAEFISSFPIHSVLDAGCGTGRVAIELARRGFDVVGVDLDEQMLDAAREKAPKLSWSRADLVSLDLDREFDAVVMAGNVMIFVTKGTEGAVLAKIADHIVPGGYCVAGFSLLRGGLDLATYDDLANRVGLVLEQRFGTWDRVRFTPGGDYAVSVHRKGDPGANAI